MRAIKTEQNLTFHQLHKKSLLVAVGNVKRVTVVNIHVLAFQFHKVFWIAEVTNYETLKRIWRRGRASMHGYRYIHRIVSNTFLKVLQLVR